VKPVAVPLAVLLTACYSSRPRDAVPPRLENSGANDAAPEPPDPSSDAGQVRDAGPPVQRYRCTGTCATDEDCGTGGRDWSKCADGLCSPLDCPSDEACDPVPEDEYQVVCSQMVPGRFGCVEACESQADCTVNGTCLPDLDGRSTCGPGCLEDADCCWAGGPGKAPCDRSCVGNACWCDSDDGCFVPFTLCIGGICRCPDDATCGLADYRGIEPRCVPDS